MGVAAGSRGFRQVGTGDGRRVPGAVTAVVLLQLFHLHRAEHSQHRAGAGPGLCRGVSAVAGRADSPSGVSVLPSMLLPLVMVDACYVR